MELSLRNIHYYGEDKSRIVISIEARYGWEGDNYAEVIKVNYSTIKKHATVTVKAKNPGVSLILKRIIEVISKINFESENIKNPATAIITELHTILKMTFDEGMKEKTMEN